MEDLSTESCGLFRIRPGPVWFLLFLHPLACFAIRAMTASCLDWHGGTERSCFCGGFQLSPGVIASDIGNCMAPGGLQKGVLGYYNRYCKWEFGTNEKS